MLKIPMPKLIDFSGYRQDIDGVRAIAVLSVILFHAGMLPAGYLGVDVFFVISGYLITGLLCDEMATGKLSISNFYMRRIRRIIPLSLLVSVVAMLLGLMVMLPSDMRGLAGNVVATNLSANNILQAITTKDYWDVVNDYKPLMHTWSLGVEEQYYLLYPFLLVACGRNAQRFLWAISVLAVVSFVICFLPQVPHYFRFYYLPFRFWELAIGGIAAITMHRRQVQHHLTLVPIVGLVVLLGSSPDPEFGNWLIFIATSLTVMILLGSNSSGNAGSLILENRLMVWIGKISFSLYMWHQVVLAFYRYLWSQDLDGSGFTFIIATTFMLSVLSYYFVEGVFRDRQKTSSREVLIVCGVVFLLSTLGGLFIFRAGGIVRDVPELEITRQNKDTNKHEKFNTAIYELDRDFEDDGRIKVFVIGDSFARDWVNLLLNLRNASRLQISYAFSLKDGDYSKRISGADVIFASIPKNNIVQKYGLNPAKLWVVGPKNFGTNNGIFYNYSGPNYYQQRTLMEKGYLASNLELKDLWGDRYLDIISKVMDDKNTVPVFTPDGKFISMDCRHLTIAGARYLAGLFEEDLDRIFAHVK